MLNRYIVILKHNADNSDIEQTIADVESAGGKLAHRYRGALHGFAAGIPDDHLRLLQDSCKAAGSKISRIEPDGVMQIKD